MHRTHPPRRPGTAPALCVATLAMLLAAVPTTAAVAQEGTITTPGGVCADPPAAGFTDIGEDAYFADAADCLAALDAGGTPLLAGYPDDTFRPDLEVSRADTAVLVARLLGYVAGQDVIDSDDGDTDFTDLDGTTDEQRAAIASLVDLGVVSGTSATTYAPGRTVARGEAASLLVRADAAARELRPDDALPLVGELAPSTDKFRDDDDSVHGAAIDTLAAARVLGGFQDGTARPRVPVTRAQLVAFEARYLQYVTDSSDGFVRGALLEPADLPGGTGDFQWRIAVTDRGLVPSSEYYDPCDPTDYPTDDDRVAGARRDLAITDVVDGSAPETPYVAQQVARYDDGTSAAEAFAGFRRVTEACDRGTESRTAPEFVDTPTDDLLLIRQRFVGVPFVTYTIVARAGDAVTIAQLSPGESSGADAFAREVAEALREAVRPE